LRRLAATCPPTCLRRSTVSSGTRELREVEDRFERAQLLTLLGPGGTRKTRLAVQLARELCDGFDDLVYLVDLSTCRDVDSVLSWSPAPGDRYARAGDRPLLGAIKEQIGSQLMLLVFDNFEQVTVAAATVAELLLLTAQNSSCS
jgi:predicted ATPase